MRVLVAMSGGVDSSVAAALLVEQGHEVVGATLSCGAGPGLGCCSVADVVDARRVAQQLGITHHVFDLTEEFDRLVVAPYVGAHARGGRPTRALSATAPSNSTACSTRADRLGFHRLATGHHARVEVDLDGARLAASPRRRPGQGPVLRTFDARAGRLLPWCSRGRHDQGEVRAAPAVSGCAQQKKPDSQDVCFIGSAEGREGSSRRVPLHAADVVDGEGRPGRSVDAVELVTVGQRHGMGHGTDGSGAT